MYELAQDSGRPTLREVVQVSRRNWDGLESREQQRILAALFKSIRYDHSKQLARLQLADSTGEPEEIEVRIHRRLFEPRDNSRTGIIGESAPPRRPAKTSRLIPF